jgi:hypothetical protein
MATFSEIHKAVKTLTDDTTINLKRASKLMSHAMVHLDPHEVRWAVEEEIERRKLEDLVALTAAVHYMRALTK